MYRKLGTLLLCFILVSSLVGCSEEITLNLTYGDRTGKYSGEMVDGIPHGQGKFTSQNSDGEKWTYEGEFKNGHFDGEGKTTWANGQVEIGTYKDDTIIPIKGDEIKSLYTTPENLKNHCVEIIGKVFTAPEYTDDCVAVQMWEDTENAANNTIVYIYDKDFKVNVDDYLKVVGIVGDTFTGENALGGEVTAPTITASEYEVVSYQDALAPATKSIDVNDTQTQYGYSVTVQKVEFSERETRIYVKVENQGSSKISIYGFNAKVSQNGKQYGTQDNWDAGYPEIQSELLAGNTTEGIIVFPVLEKGDFSITFEGYSENWEEDIKPYTFNITV